MASALKTWQVFARSSGGAVRPDLLTMGERRMSPENLPGLTLTFHDLDLVLCQPVQLVHERVDLLVHLRDVTLNGLAVIVEVPFGLGIVLVQFQHLFDERDETIMLALVGWIVEVDQANRNVSSV